MNLHDLITLRQSGVRSVNVEQDLSNEDVAAGYVLTAQSRACLGRMMAEINGMAPHRAWTLTGPYGSGKSYFGLFLLNLLSTQQHGYRKALSQLQSVDLPLAEQVTRQTFLGTKRGFLPVAITGYRTTFQECLAHGLVKSLNPLSHDLRVKSVLERLEPALAGHSRSVMNWLQDLLLILTSEPHQYSGLLFVFDEMGKPLEYAASHPDQADIYLLQELAEFANRSGDTPLVFVGILHQAFERYAVLMDSTTQREWAKVQGRFEDIAFQEPPELQMRLISSAFEYTSPKLMVELISTQKEQALQASRAGWLPAMMKEDELVDLAQRTYPMHPTTFIALPHIFRRLAQNERSIFAYLASYEPCGFQEFLAQHSIPDVIRLPHLFDYLAANFQGRLYTSSRARALTETLERLNNSIRLSCLDAEILKTIGLLNWLGEVSHVQATEACIISALRTSSNSDEEIRQALSSLQKRSIIVYRRFNQAYAIWQGSDVDIEDRLQRAQEQMTTAFSLADAVQRYLPPRPLIARRHSYEKGIIRYFEVRYVDMQTLNTISLVPNPGASGSVLICLPGNHAEQERFRNWAQTELRGQSNILVGVSRRVSRLYELLHELRSLVWVNENTPELRDDPVARRELRTRISSVEGMIRHQLDQSISLNRLSESAGCTWLWQGNEVTPRLGESLSHLLSTICDELYPYSPVIKNELINRRVPSPQAAAARRNLIEAMLTHPDIPGLGIEGYPPERSMYESILKAGGLHREGDSGKWEFSAPIAGNDTSLHLLPSWQKLEEMVFPVEPVLQPLKEVYACLTAPPYGIADGVLPIFLFVFWHVHQDEMTIYREGTLLPEPQMADWEVLIRRPDLFSVSGCRVTGNRLAVVERLARGLQTEPAVMPVVRTLIRRLKQLPEYAWRTRQLPDSAIQLRTAIDQARSPERFLFFDLPLALGLAAFEESSQPSAERLEEFFQRLNTALESLMNATPRCREWARDEFLAACGLPGGNPGWELFYELADGMIHRTTHPQLLPLLKRVVESSDLQAALDSTLALIANRPLRTWTDADAERFQMQARYLGNLLKERRSEEEAERLLTPSQRLRSQQLSVEIQQYLTEHYHDSSPVIQAAIRRLMHQWDAQADLEDD